MTDKELAEIRARCEAATPGPWKKSDEASEDYYVPGWEVRFFRGPDANFRGGADCIDRKEDAEFIAHARSDIPVLLAEVDSRFTEAEVREILSLIAWDGYMAPEARGGKSGVFDDMGALLAHIRAKRT